MKEFTITKDRYKQLLRSEAHLNELDARGVDNWTGYVGSMYYCRECDKETEWYEMNSECPHCGAEEDSW